MMGGKPRGPEVALNTRHIETFVTVTECGSFSKAAQELSTTPSALTQQVNALERELGFALLTRDYRGVAPTAGGTVFFERAKEILRLVNEAREESLEAEGLVKNTIRFGSYRNLDLILFKHTLAGFSQACPDVEMRFSGGDYRGFRNDLVAGRIDLFTWPWASELDCPGIGFQKVGATRPACTMAYDHPLAGRKTLTPADLVGQDVIVGCGCGSHMLDGLLKQLDDVGYDIRMHRFEDDDEMWTYILTRGYLFLNMDYTAKYTGGGISLPLEWPELFDYGFVYRDPCSRSVRRFLDFAAAHPEPSASSAVPEELTLF